jgi:hypothetical protein
LACTRCTAPCGGAAKSLTAVPLCAATQALRGELDHVKVIAGRATATWDRFRKERDFHRMHHKRVGQEKSNLVQDLARLRKHFAHYEPTIKELRHKYEVRKEGAPSYRARLRIRQAHRREGETQCEPVRSL